MKKLITILSALALSVSFATAADAEKKAEKKAGGGAEERFKKLDTNNDGSLSLDELKASPQGQRDATKVEAMFKAKDKDGDGKLSLAEFTGGGEKKGGEKTATVSPETGAAGKAATTTTPTDGGKANAGKPADAK